MRVLAMAAVLAVGLAGCQNAPAPRLSASLSGATDITLEWTGTDPAAAGLAVDFATEPDGPYTTLQFVPPTQTTYRHPDVMPQTTFYYRIRPYYGPASAPVDVTLPPGDHVSDSDWRAPVTVPDPSHSVRLAGAGPPTGLRATVMDANGIRFTWRDTASDEDGYLIEVKPAGSTGFSPVAVLDPQVNAYGLVTLPSEKQASYRVRAFYYGEPSTIAHQRSHE